MEKGGIGEKGRDRGETKRQKVRSQYLFLQNTAEEDIQSRVVCAILSLGLWDSIASSVPWTRAM